MWAQSSSDDEEYNEVDEELATEEVPSVYLLDFYRL